MRPLKRPMFRYGGDVKKQGIMHGMNGLRDGGVATTMADATGYSGGGIIDKTKNYVMNNKLKLAGYGSSIPVGIDLFKYLFAGADGGRARSPMKSGGNVGAGLVGDPRYPQQGGRAMHNSYLFPETGTSSAMPRTKLNIKSIKDVPKSPGQVLSTAAKIGAKKFLPKDFLKGAGTKGLGYLKNFYDKRISLPKFRRPGFQKQGPLYKVPAMERAGNFVRNNKLLTGAGLVYAPPLVGGLYSAAEKIVPPVASFFTPDYIENRVKKGYGAVKKALGFEEDKVPPPGEDGTGNVPDAVKNPPKTQAEIDAEKEIKDKQKLDKIYKLLGVDRAKRNAASKALIDMSRYIDEGGKDVISKKNLGSTISKAIGAFDKRLDKADQLKEAAGLMMAKGEIEAMSDPNKKKLQKLQIELGEDKLRPGVNSTLINSRTIKKGALTEQETIDAVRIGAANEGSALLGSITSDQIDDGNYKGKTVIDIVTDLKPEKNGYFVIGKSIVKVESGVPKLISGPLAID